MARHRIALFVLSIVSMLMAGCLGTSADSSFQTEMLQRMKSLETLGQQQAEKIQAMETRLDDQERTISEYKQKVTALENTVAELQHTRDSDVADIDHYKQRVADLEQTVTELQRKHDPETDEDQVDSNAGSNQIPDIVRQAGSGHTENRPASMRIRRALVNAEGPVAFHAVITTADVDHLGLNQKIVFPYAMTNLGGGYHNQHGIFIAPQPGVYIFSTSIMAQDRVNHPEVYVHLMKNGQVLANAYAHAETGRWDQGSVTVVTQLVAGDEVWVSLYGPGADASTHGNYYDSFMGCLVFPL